MYASAAELAVKLTRHNPYLESLCNAYGSLPVAHACETVLGFPPQLVTTGGEIAAVAEKLAAADASPIGDDWLAGYVKRNS